MKLNFLLKLSDLKWNFAVTLGYFNPALSNPAQLVAPFEFGCDRGIVWE